MALRAQRTATKENTCNRQNTSNTRAAFRKHTANTENTTQYRHMQQIQKTTTDVFPQDTKNCWTWLWHACCHNSWLVKLLKTVHVSSLYVYVVDFWLVLLHMGHFNNFWGGCLVIISPEISRGITYLFVVHIDHWWRWGWPVLGF